MVFMITKLLIIKYLLSYYGNVILFQNYLEENELRSATLSFKSLILLSNKKLSKK